MLIDENFCSLPAPDVAAQLFTWGKDSKDKQDRSMKIASELRENDLERLLSTISGYGTQDERERMLKMLYDTMNGHPELKERVAEAIVKNSSQQEIQRGQEQRIAEIGKEAERQILDAARLLASPRSLDNSSFKGKALTSQENETLDLVEQLKKNLENDQQALAKIKAAGLSTQDLGEKNVGKAGVGPLKGCEVVARTEESAILLKGKSLYIYSLKKLDLESTSTIKPGQKIDLSWAHGKEKATVHPHAQEIKKTHTRQIEHS